MDTPVARSFRIGPCVGRGGFGEVYRATMRTSGGLETEVALKLLRPDPLRRADAGRRFRDEGRMLSRLRHPAVVRAVDWADLGDGHQALVTEFVDGADLGACCAAGLPPRALLEVVGAVASALDASFHTPGPDGAPLRVIHRDIKPTNIRIGRHGQVRLLDFGIASFGSDEREARTESDLVVGSMPYMAPERFSERSSSPAADQYGLGCCLFEGLAGEPFHLDARLRELSALALDPHRAADHRARRLEALSGVPAEVRSLLERCLAHDPADRPSAAEVAAACESLAETTSGPTLRRWCAEHGLPELETFPSDWTGKVVSEGGEAPAEGEAPADPGSPRIVTSPRATLDPESGVAPPAPAPPASPRPSPDGTEVGRGARAALGLVGGLGCAMIAAAGLGAVALAVVAAVDATW